MVLGASGMLGHRVTAAAVARGHEVIAVMRRRDTARAAPELFCRASVLAGVDLTMDGAPADLVRRHGPDVVINAAGLVKQRAGGDDAAMLDPINAELPHMLAEACRTSAARLVHVSTDCVFSGDQPNADETTTPRPSDGYGDSKLRGEPSRSAIVVRTSMVGRELVGSTGLLEWLIARRGQRVTGFRHAVFSGLGTPDLAEVLLDVAERCSDGLWHVASEPIDKATLLTMLARAMDLDVEVEPVDDPVVDRSLDGSKLRAAGIRVPDWPAMVSRLAEHAHCYERWRTAC
jgi:dTDP-4-dehydrorhamnose reductase